MGSILNEIRQIIEDAKMADGKKPETIIFHESEKELLIEECKLCFGKDYFKIAEDAKIDVSEDLTVFGVKIQFSEIG